ncbi:MAG: hypothetical protein V8T09_02400 [Oscillospiraceae bacterium]
MDIVYEDKRIVVAVKPAGVVSVINRAECPSCCGRRCTPRAYGRCTGWTRRWRD